MRVLIFDTETISLNKPFCYDIGYIIVETKTKKILVKRNYIVSQVWYNLPLFATAYYSEKRPIYIGKLRNRSLQLKPYGVIMRKIEHDIKRFNVTAAYAYNSKFDEKVFQFNCDWYKNINPLETLPIYDIRGYVHANIINEEDFIKFCDDNEYYTEYGNYSTTAETVYRYLKQNTNFIEDHTALSDSLIEFEILQYCIEKYGLKWNYEYKTKMTISRPHDKIYTVVKNGREIFEIVCGDIKLDKAKKQIIVC